MNAGSNTNDTPGGGGNSDLKNLRFLINDTRDKFQHLHPDDNRWPCPFCIFIGNTKIQCRIHVRKDHPNILYSNAEEFSQFLPTNSTILLPDSPRSGEQAQHAFSTDDLNEFLKLIHENDSTSVNANLPSTVPLESSSSHSSQNEVRHLFCPRCPGSSKTFKCLRGLKQHYSHKHKEFLSDFDNPHQFQSSDSQQSRHLILSHDPNDMICHRCTSNTKFFKGIRGLRIHYGIVHKEFLSDLSPTTITAMHNHDQLDSSSAQSQLIDKLLLYRQTIRVLKRVPKGARISAAKKLQELITSCESSNDLESWINLLSFSYIALQVPKRSSRKNKLAAIIKKNILNFDNSPILNQVKPKTASLAKRVEMKISDGDIRGAVKILSSNDDFAPQNQETLNLLRLKHPSPLCQIDLSASPQENDARYVTNETEVHKAIFNFPNGSASGIDGLRPQILKDLLCKESGEIGNQLLLAITKLCNHMLAGKVSACIIPVLYGASLCALNKDDGGLRPIAIGVTFRRLTAKIACHSIRGPIGDYLRPHQLGFASKGGCEAAIHASRSFLVKNYGKSKVILKIDFRNAFNTIDRNIMLQAIKDKVPELFPFLWQCYASSTHLFFGNDIISSQTGAQQGDPCGPLLFCLIIQPMIDSLLSELNVWYLDDGTVAGEVDSVLEDFVRIIDFGKQIGLEINFSKCELFFCSSFDQTIYDKFAMLSPNIKLIESDLHLLGAPLADSSYELIFNKKFSELETMFSRLADLNHHIAYFLLKHCFAVPKLTFLLRTFPIWKFPNLVFKFDNLIFQTLKGILNVHLSNEKWILASLPIRNGGVGIRRVQDIAIPSFISSVIGSSELICTILPSLQTDFSELSGLDAALNDWYTMCPDTLPPTQQSSQHQWDDININRITNGFSFNSDTDKARYKASLCKEAGVWLTVLPSRNLATLLDNNSFRIATALRLGCDICVPHRCVCGDFVDRTGIHGLSCPKSAGRQYRHRHMNDIIKRTLNSAEIPSRLEPEGLCRNDGKRPDGMTLVPFSHGQILVWDATCWDTLAPSYVKKSAVKAGSVAKMAANRKRSIYSDVINQNFLFIPFACETIGAWCEEAVDLVNRLGSLIRENTGEPRSKSFIIQKLSITIQRSNAACIMGSLPESDKLNEIYFLL